MKFKKLPLLLTAAVLIYSMTGFAQTWQHVGGAGFTGTNVKYTSLTIGKNDTPMIAFRDNGFAGGKTTVMKYAGGSWTNVGNAGFSPNAVSEVVLTTDSTTHTPYIAYVDTGAGVTVAKYNGTSWGFIGAPGFPTNNQSDNISLAISSNGTPYICFRDGNQSYKANVMKYSGGSWNQVGTANFSATTSEDVKLVLDHHDVPYVLSTLSSNTGVQVQKYNGSAWVTVGNIGFDTSSFATKGSIAIGPNNQLYVALTNNSAPYKAHVWSYSGSTWVPVGTSITSDYAYDVQLVISKLGVPILSYQDNSGSTYKASAVYYNGSIWNNLGSPGFTAAEADYTSLAVNSMGDVYLAYEDFGNGNAGTVDKFLHTTGIHEGSGLSEFKLYPNPNNGKFQISYKAVQEGEVQLSVTNMMGQTVWQDTHTNSNGVESIDLTGVAAGLYTLQVKTNNGIENRLVEIK